jgi:hypothetical protein
MAFVRLAKEFLNIDDFELIGRHRIGEGKIGGKAAGMLAAWKILQREEPSDGLDMRAHVVIPDSYFIGADVFYEFHAINGLSEFINQKYKTKEEIEEDYPRIKEAYARGTFPRNVMIRLRSLLRDVGTTPIIVRSSSLLEDNFGFSFAGKYESYFLPNQNTLEGNLRELTWAITQIYASVLAPDALFYRQRMGLVDYDERMAILIQTVQGHRYRHYFFPALAGVGFSRNPFRWNRKIDPQAGLLRLVWGLGTRAVERVGNDYPRMVALSHPQLRPEVGTSQVRRYAQHYVDVLDLKANALTTLPVDQVLGRDYPNVRLLASEDKGDYLQPIYATGLLDSGPLVLTFDELLKQKEFVTLMRAALAKLERHYGCPVDIEFTVAVADESPRHFILHLLQCRPLSGPDWDQAILIPEDVPEEDIVFIATKLVPHGIVDRIRYLVYVDPDQYDELSDFATRFEIARVVGRLNQRLAGESFILMGPGRWGSSNAELGLKVTYADIYNTRALIEVAHARGGSAPELSYGTHFFQDLVETRIYPLPLYPDEPGAVLNEPFFREAPNALPILLPDDARFATFVKVINIPEATGDQFLELVMDSEEEKALAYLKTYEVGKPQFIRPITT